MCLYPKLIKNRKYTVNDKNGGDVPPITDHRVAMVPVGCGKCMECRKQYQRQWQVRLLEDVRTQKNGKFITLTYSNEQLTRLYQYVTGRWPHLKGYDIDNAIATWSVRKFLERWRKEYGKSLRHWLVTELGQTRTEHLHMHGIIWTDESLDKVEQHWQYGWIWKGKKQHGAKATDKLINYVNGATVNYITKYVSKMDVKHPEYKAVILTSPGIGGEYVKTHNAGLNKYNGTKTKETYRTETGHKIGMPIYWRNKLYTDDQKEKLWIQKLDKQERWVCGEKIDISKSEDDYYGVLKHYRKINTRLGYGNNNLTWEQKQYENERRNLKIKERIIIKEEKTQPKSITEHREIQARR